jgi:hypothetical protein
MPHIAFQYQFHVQITAPIAQPMMCALLAMGAIIYSAMFAIHLVQQVTSHLAVFASSSSLPNKQAISPFLS